MENTNIMEITCNTNELSQACQNVQRATTVRSVSTALEGILFNAKDSKLCVTGYNLETGITTSVAAKVHTAGSIVINAHLLCDILRKTPFETVTITVSEKLICKVSSGDMEYKLVGTNASEFPELPKVEDALEVTVSSDTLRNMIKQTAFAASTNDGNVLYTAVRFEITNNNLKLIATDGYRLALRSKTIIYNGEDTAFSVPAKALTELVRLSRDTDSISIKATSKHILFGAENYHLITRIINGNFLNYDSAIPKTFATNVTVEAVEFLDAVDRTSLLISDRMKTPVRFEFADDSAKMSVVTSIGAANDKLAAKITGNAVTIGLNDRFVSEAIKACDSEYVVVKLNNSLSPIVIVPTDNSDANNALYLILPVRMREN